MPLGLPPVLAAGAVPVVEAGEGVEGAGNAASALPAVQRPKPKDQRPK